MRNYAMAQASKTVTAGYSAELGSRLALAIERAGGVGRAASQLEVTRETVGRWRDGGSPITLHKITRLAEIADVSPIWLAFGEDADEREEGAVPIWAIKQAWEWWMPVVFALADKPDPQKLLAQFLDDVVERAGTRQSPEQVVD